MRSRCARTVILGCLGLCVVLTRPAAAAETRLAKAQKAVASMIQKSSVRPVDAKVIAADARRIVQSLDEEQITRLLAGESLTTVLAGRPGAAKIAGGTAATAAATPTLGDSQSDLVFV